LRPSGNPKDQFSPILFWVKPPLTSIFLASIWLHFPSDAFM
jgi:hypothetical protein